MLPTKWILIAAVLDIAICGHSAVGQFVAPLDSAYVTLRGKWNLTSNHGYPYSIEIDGRKIRIPTSNECVWLPYQVLSDRETRNPDRPFQQIAEPSFRRITIEIMHMPGIKKACIQYPILQFIWRLPAEDVYGNGPTHAAVELFSSHENLNNGESAAYWNYSRQGP
jgi:hypothetical protein